MGEEERGEICPNPDIPAISFIPPTSEVYLNKLRKEGDT